MVKEAQIEKAEMKNLLLFCNIELVEFCRENGIFWIRFSKCKGNDFLFCSLFIEASFGVILKMEIEARSVAKTTRTTKERPLSIMIGKLKEAPIVGTQYVFTIE